MTTGLRGSGIIEELIGKIEYQGVEVVLYDKVESNPKDYNVMEAAALYQQEKCDSIISVGGGSSHDAAKGARVVIAHDGRNINEFEGFAKSTNKENPPHIAVSTTAGTGSETSWAYVITDTSDMDHPHKWVGFDEATIVTLAIDDPLCTTPAPSTSPPTADSTFSRTVPSPSSRVSISRRPSEMPCTRSSSSRSTCARPPSSPAT
jgi:formaldehyde dismutase / methanol dehydrogenase